MISVGIETRAIFSSLLGPCLSSALAQQDAGHFSSQLKLAHTDRPDKQVSVGRLASLQRLAQKAYRPLLAGYALESACSTRI